MDPAHRDRLLIVHCDDVGLSWEANEAARRLLTQGVATSCSVMVPCPWSYEFLMWYREHPKLDVGIHLTLTSEWATYRWPPLTAGRGLRDKDGFMHRRPEEVIKHASVEEVYEESKAQVQRALEWGVQLTHLDTHMGASLASYGFAQAYLRLAESFGLPPMLLKPTPELQSQAIEQGYDLRIFELMEQASTPTLTGLFSAARKGTYRATKEAVYRQLAQLPTGVSYFIIHPALASDTMRAITGSWQQRYFEYLIFMEEETRRFIEAQGIQLVSWRKLQASTET